MNTQKMLAVWYYILCTRLKLQLIILSQIVFARKTENLSRT